MFTVWRLLVSSLFVLLTNTWTLGQSQGPDTIEVLARYRASLSYLRSVSLKVAATVDSTAGDSKLFPQTLEYVFRRDEATNRAEWVGTRLIRGEDGKMDPWNSDSIKEIADGHMYVSLEKDRLVEESNISALAIMWYDYKEKLKDSYENPNYGAPLFGTMFGSSRKSVADLLEASPDLHARGERETINGVACLVLEGASQYGKVTTWIAPEKGYSAMKWTIEKDAHHLFDGTPLSEKWPELAGERMTFEAKEVQEIGTTGSTIYVPGSAVFTLVTNYYDGKRYIDKYEYKVSDVQPNPDFAALGAFKIELRDGVRVSNKDAPSLHFRWKDGRPIVVVDKSFLGDMDKEIAALKAKVQTEGGGTTATLQKLASEETSNPAAVPHAPASNPVRIWVYVAMGIVAIGIVGGLVFRLRRA